MISESIIRHEIENKIKTIFKNRKKGKIFIPGKTWIQYAGAVFDEKEINASLNSLLDGWFGLGKKAVEMENKLANFLDVKGSLLVNSGSSANLLSVAALCSPLLENHLNTGDEIITTACGFPTTVNPLIFYGLIPVFLDVDSENYNLSTKDLGKALTNKTKAVLIAHTLGNPNDMEKIVNFCRQNNLFLLEDNCDALGSTIQRKYTGSFGIMSTQSFYPPHHLTMGEGGAVNFNELRFEKILRSLRDWGRACWCRGDEKRTLGACQARFNFKLAGKFYDHKYIFNQIGFNLKPIEPQAAMGAEQLKRLPFFIKIRQKNFQRLYNYSKNWEKYFIIPKSLPEAEPCWFSFPLTIRDDVKFTRHALTLYLESKMIQTRPLFGSNLTRQPAYKHVKYRKIGSLKNSDRILFNTFFVGIYPGLGYNEIDYIAQCLEDFLKKNK